VEVEIRRTIGRTYEALGLYKQAERHFRRALDLCQHLDGPQGARIASRLAELGNAYQGQGKLN